MDVELLTLTGKKYGDKAREVIVKTTEGDIVILPTHEPYMTIIAPGPLTIVRNDGSEDTYSVYGGVVDVTSGSQVKILVDEAEHIDDLIEEEIEQALQLAKELKEDAKDRQSLHRAQSLIDRHQVRLNVSRIRRRPKTLR